MKSFLVLTGVAMFLTGCGHSMMRGTVAMKTGKDEAHICLGDNAVKGGDKVAFFENNCISTGSGDSERGGGGREIECNLLKIGEGTVSKTLNSHYSLVKTDGSFSFEEGTMVERVRK
jgi:hypothetical protein|tara:strand:+ start:13545 stop:13895 length:351 start_codon:yes stop_codon:yes gene_type:complete